MLLIFTFFLAALAVPTFAASLVTPEKEEQLLKEVKVPDGFEAKIFAAAPEVNYPVFVATAPDGTVFVSSDKNGSLDRGAHRGRVLRVRDVDGDGHADEVKEFVKDVDSPRGLLWDRDRLYLLHPPHLSVFIDHDGDGVSDEQKILVKNIAFGFKDRPADHSSNGIEMGVDGWIYCAIGDFGFMQAEGTDGRKLQLRGGGVVRLRPDGSGLELYSRGTRNILEVAVGPRLDMFARDNTNDGDGWDIRLHHFTPLSNHGYPSLFKNFSDEIIQPLAIYGGGSGCGAMFLDEPGFPEEYNNMPYTADWGREWIYRHPVTPNGATFKAEQHEFVRAPRVTDLDVDAMSRIYVASWKGASFTYVGENVGFLVRVTPKDFTAEPLPEFEKIAVGELVSLLDSPSHRRRLAAQRELLHRELTTADHGAIEKVAADKTKTLATRVAALFLLKQSQRTGAHEFLVKLGKADATIREFCVRAVCDRLEQLEGVPGDQIASALADENPRVRREAAFALARLGDPAQAEALAKLLADSDPIVAHTVMQSLKKLHAAEACLKIVDNSGATSEERAAALRVLQALHQPAVVHELLDRLHSESDPARRRGLITAVARLYHTNGEWKGDSWGTRPDTTGPYYQPVEWSESPQILTVLKRFLDHARGEEAEFLVGELGRHKIQTEETLARVVALAAENKSLLAVALPQLARADKLPEAATALLVATATSADGEGAARAQAVAALSKIDSEEAVLAILKAMPEVGGGRGNRDAQQARQAFLRSRHLAQHQELLAREAARLGNETATWADAALLALSDRRNASAESKAAARAALEEGWSEPKRQAQILRAVALAEHRSWKEKVIEAAASSNKDVAEAALRAARALRIERELQEKKAVAGGVAGVETMIADMKAEEVVNRVSMVSGDAKLGAELFVRQACVNCHTVGADEPLKGPFLGNIANTFKRPELAEAILIPNKTIAQGFVANQFVLKDGTEHEGFVVQEAADKVVIRNVAAQEIQIETKEIAERKKSEKSLMPEGLAANLTVKELAALVAYLESLGEPKK